MNKAAKQDEIELLKQRLSTAQIAVFADFNGLTVEQITNLRAKLREAGASAKVVKNTLTRIAAADVFKENEAADLEKLIGLLEGPNMLTFSAEDVVGPAKVLTKFAKENEKLEIKGGWCDGKFIDSKDVDALSKMPSKEETLAKLLALLNTPATKVVQLLQAPASQLVRTLAAYRDKLEKGS
ncbi:MAG: 50S ribosomal protein L10 [Deltaproteobacteria bacterium]|nr:50S ribosomal protein L10 [Deltaproteobacteria bacterium]